MNPFKELVKRAFARSAARRFQPLRCDRDQKYCADALIRLDRRKALNTLLSRTGELAIGDPGVDQFTL
jgi:hypothetical protein